MSFMFKFPDPVQSGQDASGTQSSTDKMPEESNGSVEAFREIFHSGIEQQYSETLKQTYQLSDGVCIQCLDSQAVERRLSELHGSSCGVTRAAEQHSDLIPNVYEGGLKVWECALDLLEYLNKNDVPFHKKHVLELGCGAGLPGIIAMLSGAESVHLQDYNVEVIEHYTIPNVMLNKPDGCTCTCRYFSGDWTSFREHMSKQDTRYDIILTAETIYKPENYRKLSAIFEDFLSQTGCVGWQPFGQIDPFFRPLAQTSFQCMFPIDRREDYQDSFIAAKSNYFGVGGGTKDFESFINNEGRFNVSTCDTVESGVPREIMKLTWQK